MKRPLTISLLFVVVLLARVPSWGADSSGTRWWQEYSGTEATGSHVLGYWRFDSGPEELTRDSSSHSHEATLRGQSWNAEGRFGGSLESFAGYPIADESHAIHVSRSSVLSPTAAFTVELWIKPKDEDSFPPDLQPVLLDMKYVPTNHTGFMFSLTGASDEGARQMKVEIGVGHSSETWYSPPVAFPAGQWRHVAFSFDARGTVTFFVDGALVGRVLKPAAGPMATAVRPLAIGDRIGSLYRGFPGYIDEVRITSGEPDFRLIRFEQQGRRVFRRMSPTTKIVGTLVNQTGELIDNVKLTLNHPDGTSRELAGSESLDVTGRLLELPVDSSLKPGDYELVLTMELPGLKENATSYRATNRIPFTIVRRLPPRMPVVMWGIGGTEGVLSELPRLKRIGFTHCLGLRVDYQQVWKDGTDALPQSPTQVQEGREMLDVALKNEFGIVASLSPGRWLRSANQGRMLQRFDRDGQPYSRHDVNGLLSPVQQFCYDTGAAMGRAYGDHPAFSAALLHTEVRGESQVSFREEDVKAYRQATGQSIPERVNNKNGVDYRTLPDFPKDRVIADDNPILQYYQWFWTVGDGWNQLNTRLHTGLHEQIEREDFWTFHDPAVRVPSIHGSGGTADVLSHWTYSYPDPIRIGLCADELFEMARAGGRDQDVMKMTQLIWYRSQTAPKGQEPDRDPSPWVDQDPGAAYITIAPMHLREALWWKLARPVKGIMYHGWQSLVDTNSPGAYRFTNESTQHELQRLIHEVVEPLGPALLQIPDAPSDVVFLESFTSQMFARRGTYGWNHTWAGDMYHVLMYAQLQPRVMYEETLLAEGLEGTKVLVLADCDVLTESVVEAIRTFQAAGGLVIGDDSVCPAIKLDHTVPRFSRTGDAQEARTRLLQAAAELRQWLDSRYERSIDSTNPDVVTRRRRFAGTDYIFAVNDRREFGSYVGGYGLVMENGLPSDTTIRLNRQAGFVYDLTAGRQMDLIHSHGTCEVPLHLGPCEGQLLMVTERPIKEVEITAPESAQRGDRIELRIGVTDGESPIEAVVPVQLQITDPESREAEYSGYYGAVGGILKIAIDFAPNDITGVWRIKVRELASGESASAYLRLESERQPLRDRLGHDRCAEDLYR